MMLMMSTAACSQQPQLGKDKIDLEHFPKNFDAFAYYEKAIKDARKSFEYLNNGEKEKAFALDYYNIDGIDTIRVTGQKDLYLFDMDGAQFKTKHATFGNINFEQLSMVTNDEKKVIALDAVSYSFNDGEKNFQNLKNLLEAKYGKPKVIPPTFAGLKYDYYTWDTDEYNIRLTIDKNHPAEGDFKSTLFFINKAQLNTVKKSLVKVRNFWDFDDLRE